MLASLSHLLDTVEDVGTSELKKQIGVHVQDEKQEAIAGGSSKSCTTYRAWDAAAAATACRVGSGQAVFDDIRNPCACDIRLA